jgi:hypothetical protein
MVLLLLFPLLLPPTKADGPVPPNSAPLLGSTAERERKRERGGERREREKEREKGERERG